MKTYLAAILIVGAITAAIVGFVLWDNDRTSERLTSEARVIGFSALPVRWTDADDREVSGHTLTFAYLDASQRPHTRTVEQVTWYDPSKSYKVCYNPADPDDWKLYETSHVCGS